MSPYERMKALYEAEPEDEPFEYYLRIHHMMGYVVSTPIFFWMAMAVNRAEIEGGRSPLCHNIGMADCWYVSAYAGDMRQGWAAMPFPLQWFAFHRGLPDRKKLSIYPIERIRAKLAA